MPTEVVLVLDCVNRQWGFCVFCQNSFLMSFPKWPIWWVKDCTSPCSAHFGAHQIDAPSVAYSLHCGLEQCSFGLTQHYWSLRGTVCSQVCVSCSGGVIALLQHFWLLFQARTYLSLRVALVYWLTVIISSIKLSLVSASEARQHQVYHQTLIEREREKRGDMKKKGSWNARKYL